MPAPQSSPDLIQTNQTKKHSFAFFFFFLQNLRRLLNQPKNQHQWRPGVSFIVGVDVDDVGKLFFLSSNFSAWLFIQAQSLSRVSQKISLTLFFPITFAPQQFTSCCTKCLILIFWLTQPWYCIIELASQSSLGPFQLRNCWCTLCYQTAQHHRDCQHPIQVLKLPNNMNSLLQVLGLTVRSSGGHK